MEQTAIKQALIKSTIHTISEFGIDNATTKQLAACAGVNEVYIYRIFGGKEQLFRETFNFVDKDFSSNLLNCLSVAYNRGNNIETRFRNLFKLIWQYVIDNKEKYSFFIRYYYSRCYTKQISDERKIIYADVIKIFDTIFARGTDTWWLFNQVLDVVFSSAVKVLRDEIPNNRETEENIFLFLYAALEPHLKTNN